jgi:hypothetical protein
VIGALHSRHRATEFLAFLKTIDASVPDDLDVHLVLDNASTHKAPAVKRWLTAHPRFVVYFTPTSSSETTTSCMRRFGNRSLMANECYPPPHIRYCGTVQPIWTSHQQRRVTRRLCCTVAQQIWTAALVLRICKRCFAAQGAPS